VADRGLYFWLMALTVYEPFAAAWHQRDVRAWLDAHGFDLQLDEVGMPLRTIVAVRRALTVSAGRAGSAFRPSPRTTFGNTARTPRRNAKRSTDRSAADRAARRPAPPAGVARVSRHLDRARVRWQHLVREARGARAPELRIVSMPRSIIAGGRRLVHEDVRPGAKRASVRMTASRGPRSRSSAPAKSNR
jgi:hypothetical protein